MKKIVLSIVLFTYIPLTHPFLFFFFRDTKTPFDKAIKDIEKRDVEKLKKDTYDMEKPHEHDFAALTYTIEHKQRELEKEKERNSGTFTMALVWLVGAGLAAFAGYDGIIKENGIELATAAVSGGACLLQSAENAHDALYRDYNLKEKDRTYRKMQLVVHNAEVSRLKDKTLIEEKYESKDESK